ncbi:VCBS repeat-containing protein [Streptomyces sp. ISL-66]|uniref:FG-GAP-like repeat-containing protein n=1 Tax=Streptomyces sp. ISL-66 TaxID=2819186 RepID=UPI001BE8D015|nr:FG-GAP-like repeat-containing protein [Streptomyces sp. ISL-66]MBT2470779.1 VCBS repeat-containing protein [Streptomyces sp. ISL-66]
MSVVSYNVCGGWQDCQSPLASTPGKTPQERAGDWADDAITRARLAGTDLIMLQEMCKGQYDALLPKLAGYAGYFSSKKTYGGCGAWGSDESLGQVVLFRGATSGQINGSSVEVTAEDTRLAVCAKGPLAGRHAFACSVHLSQSTASGDMHELMDHIQAQAGGASVIVAGDFNHRPADINPALAAGVRVSGTLAEADATLNQPTTGWDSQSQPPRYTKKFDHAFFSTEDFHSPSAAVEDPQLTKVKDHALLRAFAVPRKPVPGDLTGDGRPDLLAVRKDGALRLYPGAEGGRFGSAQVLATGGFLGAVVSHRGDWTGDGREDVLARIGTELYVYPNAGGGTLGSPVTIPNRENQWGTVKPRAVGDYDGDGRPDIVVQGASGLWLHRGGDPATGPSLPYSAVRIGGAEWAYDGNLDILAPGDTGKAVGEPDGVKRADLWVRDRISGEVREYRSNGTAELTTPRTLAGDTWTAAQRPVAVSLGDGDGDGLADLWITTRYDAQTATGGDLYFRPATIDNWGTPLEVGTGGWSYIESLS